MSSRGDTLRRGHTERRLLCRYCLEFTVAALSVFSHIQGRKGRDMVLIDGRRSERVLMDVPVLVRGQSIAKERFQEETFTVTISAHGAMVMLAANVALGETITLISLKNSAQR